MESNTTRANALALDDWIKRLETELLNGPLAVYEIDDDHRREMRRIIRLMLGQATDEAVTTNKRPAYHLRKHRDNRDWREWMDREYEWMDLEGVDSSRLYYNEQIGEVYDVTCVCGKQAKAWNRADNALTCLGCRRAYRIVDGRVQVGIKKEQASGE